MAKKLQLLRNQTIFDSKALALTGLDTQLKTLAVGEPAIASYTDDDKVSILLGISYGDGTNYQIFEGVKIGDDGNLEIPQEVQDAIDKAIDALDSPDTAVAHNFVTEVKQENGKITVKRGAVASSGSTITITDGADGGINLEVVSSALTQYIGKDAIVVGADVEGEKEISLKINESDNVLTQDTSGLIANISLKYVKRVTEGEPSPAKLQLIGKDGTVITDLDVNDFVMDGMLSNAELQGDELVLTFNTDGGNKELKVNLSKYIDVYTAGNGIEIGGESGKTISVKRDSTSEDFLTVGAEGVKLSGIQDAIDAAKSKIDAYTVNKKAINTNPVLNGADIQLDGYTRSELTNEDLNIAPTDTVNGAFGKLEKAILDNEEVCSKAFDAVATAVGLKREGLAYEAPSGTNYVSGATSVQDADAKLDAAIKAVSDKIDAEVGKDCLIEVEAGNGITVTEKAESKQTISANVKSDDPIIEVTGEGIKTKDAAVWDCGTY